MVKPDEGGFPVGWVGILARGRWVGAGVSGALFISSSVSRFDVRGWGVCRVVPLGFS